MTSLKEKSFELLERGEFDQARECFKMAIINNPSDAEIYFGKALSNMKQKNAEELVKSDWGSGFIYDDDFQKAMEYADANYKKELINLVEKAKENEYIYYSELLKSSDANDIEVARDNLECLHYKDSDELFKKACEKFEKLTGKKSNNSSQTSSNSSLSSSNHNVTEFNGTLFDSLSANNSPRGLITVYSIYPMQTSLVDSYWGYPLIYSSYDGVEITWRNNCTSAVNYITFYLSAIDNANGLLKTVGNTDYAELKLVGPVQNGRIVTSSSKGFWQHGMSKMIFIQGIDFEFSDGTKAKYRMNSSHKTIGSFYSDVDLGDNIKYVKIGSSANSPCYVATCVYGSYDCPEVWALRRFRDYDLAETRHGRAFIKLYYAISPKLVKLFGNTKWFKKMWKPHLDRMVQKLKEKGYSTEPYQDRNW